MTIITLEFLRHQTTTDLTLLSIGLGHMLVEKPLIAYIPDSTLDTLATGLMTDYESPELAWKLFLEYQRVLHLGAQLHSYENPFEFATQYAEETALEFLNISG